jgi:hypothetical protein
MSKGTDVGIGLAAALATAVAVTGVSADPVAGQNLADKWCVECHGVRADRLSPNFAAPTFPELAAETSITEYSLRAAAIAARDNAAHHLHTRSDGRHHRLHNVVEAAPLTQVNADCSRNGFFCRRSRGEEGGLGENTWRVRAFSPICAIITWCGRRLLGARCARSWLCANFTDPLREVSEFLSRVK